MNVTVPNLLSLVRMGLVPIFIIGVVDAQPREALVIFGLAGLTDALDGFIARVFRQQSVLGAYLDPIADKLLLMSAFVVLAIPDLHPGTLIPIWVTILVLARDLIIVAVAVILSLAADVTRFTPTMLSKINTALQIACVVLVLTSGITPAVGELALWSTYVVAFFTVASGIDYIILASRVANRQQRRQMERSSVGEGGATSASASGSEAAAGVAATGTEAADREW